jgi:1-deoxy-D-xylulose-5-phosphate synthase
MVRPALEAAAALETDGVGAHVVNCRYLKPMDENLLVELGARFDRILTVEESAVWSGFGSNVARVLSGYGLRPELRSLGMPDRVVDHAPRKVQLEQCGLDPESIRAAALALAEERVGR